VEGILLCAGGVAVPVGLGALVAAARPGRRSQGGSWASPRVAAKPSLQTSRRVRPARLSGPRYGLKERELRRPQKNGQPRREGR
jgi:hypothetical protein